MTALIGNKFLVIYGGYNSQISDTSMLNDVVMLNLHIFQWESVAIFGYHPPERFGTCFVVDDKRLIMLGGMNERAYMDEALHILEFDTIKVLEELQERKKRNLLILNK